MTRSLTRNPKGAWIPGRHTCCCHQPRMRRAAEALLPEDAREPLSYIETGPYGALVVRTERYRKASTEGERRSAVVRAGTVPVPRASEIAAAATTLHYAGIRDPQAYGDIYLASVVLPEAPSAEDLAFYKRVTENGRRLPAEVAALYRGHLRLAGESR